MRLFFFETKSPLIDERTVSSRLSDDLIVPSLKKEERATPSRLMVESLVSPLLMPSLDSLLLMALLVFILAIASFDSALLKATLFSP